MLMTEKKNYDIISNDTLIKLKTYVREIYMKLKIKDQQYQIQRFFILENGEPRKKKIKSEVHR